MKPKYILHCYYTAQNVLRWYIELDGLQSVRTSSSATVIRIARSWFSDTNVRFRLTQRGSGTPRC